MEQQPQLNEHNKQEHPPMHTCEHIVNRTMVNLFGCGRAVSAHIERKRANLILPCRNLDTRSHNPNRNNGQ